MIGVCGYGYTGSGAVIDMLKEFSDVSVVDSYEFLFPYAPHGVLNLWDNIVEHPYRNSSDAALLDYYLFARNIYNHCGKRLKRATHGSFLNLTKDYIDELTSYSWTGHWSYDYSRLDTITEKAQFFGCRVIEKAVDTMLKDNINIYPNRKMRISSVDEEIFLDVTKRYMEKVISVFGADMEKTLILDQPFPATNPELCFKFFRDPKAIIVDRDPVDLYLAAKYQYGQLAKFIPTENVDVFIRHYKYLRRENHLKDDRILRIRFEDLVYNYETTLERICDFAKIKEHDNKYKYFDPKVSCRGTNLALKYENESINIDKIKVELEEYRYFV